MCQNLYNSPAGLLGDKNPNLAIVYAFQDVLPARPCLGVPRLEIIKHFDAHLLEALQLHQQESE